MIPRCGTCRFFARGIRNPDTLRMLPVTPDYDDNPVARGECRVTSPSGPFPIRSAFDWCGGWRPRADVEDRDD